eukprot:3300583-Lingulodinium_polyedra.AAC.1
MLGRSASAKMAETAASSATIAEEATGTAMSGSSSAVPISTSPGAGMDGAASPTHATKTL